MGNVTNKECLGFWVLISAVLSLTTLVFALNSFTVTPYMLLPLGLPMLVVWAFVVEAAYTRVFRGRNVVGPKGTS